MSICTSSGLIILIKPSSAIYDRMKADQMHIASELRKQKAEPNANAEATRSDADNKSQAVLGGRSGPVMLGNYAWRR